MNRIRFRPCIASVRAMVIAALLMYLVTVVVAPLQATGLGGAGDPFEIFFDENGGGQIGPVGGPFTAIVGVMEPDPADPAHGPVLTYHLPEHVINGDVAVLEPGPVTILTDGMRFTDANGNLDHFSQTADRMIYLSEQPDPNEVPPFDKADRGFGNFGQVNGFNGTVDEVGTEGRDGFDWFPGGNIYHGISDTPEPATVTLLGFGMLGVLAYVWRQRRKAA